jgi:hypothetical protein
VISRSKGETGGSLCLQGKPSQPEHALTECFVVAQLVVDMR